MAPQHGAAVSIPWQSMFNVADQMTLGETFLQVVWFYPVNLRYIYAPFSFIYNPTALLGGLLEALPLWT
jgi:hypothetical protein